MSRAVRPAHVLIALLALSALAGVSCGGSKRQAAPQREVVLATEADDERVGEQSAMQVGGAMGFVDDPALNAYVNEIGQRLARHAPRGRFHYQFKVIDQPILCLDAFLQIRGWSTQSLTESAPLWIIIRREPLELVALIVQFN